MASSSNDPDALRRLPDYRYLYVSNTNVSNFVSVKLCGACNYQIWKTQIMCLMEAHDMLGLVDEGSIDSSMKDMAKYDSLLKGWIFGSVSEDVLRIVVDSKSLAKAKDVWNTLKSYFDATKSSDQQETETNGNDGLRKQMTDAIVADTEVKDKDTDSGQSEAKSEDTPKTDIKDSASIKMDTSTKTKEKNEVLEDITTYEKCANLIESEGNGEKDTQIQTKEIETCDQVSLKKQMADVNIAVAENDKDINFEESKTKHEGATQPGTKDSTPAEVNRKLNKKAETKKQLQNAIKDQDWDKVCYLLWSEYEDAIAAQINSDNNTALHIAVLLGRNEVIRRVLRQTKVNFDLTGIINNDGSTFLHMAAIVGNTDAAELLIRRDTKFLDTLDKKKKTPLDKAYENMHLDTIAYLLEAAEIHEDRKRKEEAEDRKRREYAEDQKRKKDAEYRKRKEEAEDRKRKEIAEVRKNAEAEKKRKKDDEADTKNKKPTKGDRKVKEAANRDGKTTESVHGSHRISQQAADEEGKEPDEDGNGKGEVDVDRPGKEVLDDDGKGEEEPDEDGKPKEEPDVDWKGKEEPDGGGKPKEELAVDGKGKEEPKEDGKSKEVAEASHVSHLPHVEIGANLLVNAISAKQYELVLKLVGRNSKYAVFNHDALMAIARTFPSGLEDVETFFYPNLNNLCETIVKRTKDLFISLEDNLSTLKVAMLSILSCEDEFGETMLIGLGLILYVPALMVYWSFLLILLFFLMVYFPFFMLYFLFWKFAMRVVPPIKNIEQKKKEYDEANMVLELVCEKINELTTDSYEPFYARPVLEAACQNAYEVVAEILNKWPEAIRCKDENGYDIIQLATIHRSEKIYNLIYMLRDRKNIYRTMIDSSKNNMLHLAGKLAPSNRLKLRTGAALQLQNELQWREEVKKLVFPSFATKENIFNDTPDMVFSKEHENLVQEGEKWIRIVAESCSITAALITTIVFAAAITVPGGMTQETGIPVFKKEIAFTVFVVSDAISLVSSVTALLVFLSIVSARFAEQDFLLRLPRQMLIGLCTLFLSTAAMMVAFGATFFLVFTDHQLWMLAPICGLCFLPIAIYFHLQVPLIIDLFRSTYTSMFGKSNQTNIPINPNAIRFLFAKKKE